ncbi:MAG TPA: NADH-quinone oxidoreductase subunit C [Chthonomonadaceae bacterium]|nr:NADH-quinone oxidoreductase subunit C [Chthonomonadaceae bacterium]
MTPSRQPAITLHLVPLADLEARLGEALQQGSRLGLLTARQISDRPDFALMTLLLHPAEGGMALWETPLESHAQTFPSLTSRSPQAHWFERAIYDFFGIRPEGHPRFKSVILHEAWPEGFHPLRDAYASAPNDGDAPRRYKFLTVQGEGVYEIPVGPIHAGIIEPGHFRFSCLGEVIQNLEIRLGYQHRGVERQLCEIPWKRARFLAEAASSDTTAGNAWAHAMAMEQILGITPSPTAQTLRALALEIERVASHLGDLGGICNDIGFAAGAATFGCLRGRALGMGERLTGSRFQTAYILPGGVVRNLQPERRDDLLRETEALETAFAQAAPLLMENPGALERMEGTGKVRPSLARDFGLVGPAGRASGAAYDVREAFRQVPYASLTWQVASAEEGDVLARVRIRVQETHASLGLIANLATSLSEEEEVKVTVPTALPPDRVGVGVVEAWRGELIHLVFTDAAGHISRYTIKDPSFNNWTGLAIAARGELVADFPLCNKSFGLSYSGNDL